MFENIKNFLGRTTLKDEPKAQIPTVMPFVDSTIESGVPAGYSPSHIRHNIDHGSHLRIIAKNDEEAASLSLDTIRSSRIKKTIMYGEDNISGYLSDGSYLRSLTITRNGDVLSTYPLFCAGTPVSARIIGVTECENKYEGQIEVFANGAILTIFDALYFMNKDRYSPGKDVNVLITGMAYVLSKIKNADSKANKRDSSYRPIGIGEVAVRYENGDADDYVFRGIVHDVREFETMGKKAQVIKTSLRLEIDAIPMDIYICATGNAIKEKIHPGDYISGILWLQGFVTDA